MLYWVPSLIWMYAVYYLSGRTGSELQSLFPFIDNFNPGHIAAYFILAMLFFMPLSKNNSNHPYLKSFVLCLLYGLTDEIHQHFVPTRNPDPYDIARDMLGVTLALLTVWLQRKKIYRSKNTG